MGSINPIFLDELSKNNNMAAASQVLSLFF